ncbi:MAG: DUF1579 domain-containing protein [Phycisphaerales bacterium]
MVSMRMIAVGSVIAAGFVLGTALLLPTGSPSAPAAAHQDPPSMEEMMAAMEKAMTPGPEHAQLARAAGTWDLTMKIYMAGPDAERTSYKGTSVITSELGGRFILDRARWTMMMPNATGAMEEIEVEGIGITGFDNTRQMYVGSWCDSMNTHLLTMAGSMPPGSNVLTMYGEMDEPMLNVFGRTVKYVITHIDDNHSTFAIYDLHAGDDYKVVEIEYTRAER